MLSKSISFCLLWRNFSVCIGEMKFGVLSIVDEINYI